MPSSFASRLPDTAPATPTSAATAAAEVLVEAKSLSASERIFLSPHVVDANEFDAFALQLRTLIRQAEETAQTLRSAAQNARTTRAELNSTAGEQSQRLKAAAKVLRALVAVQERVGVAPKTHTDQPESNPPRDRTEPGATMETTDRARVDQLIARAHRQLAVSLDSATAEIDRRVRLATDALDSKQLQLDARLARLAKKEDAIEKALACKGAESAKLGEQGRSLAALHHRVQQAIDALEERTADHSPSPTVIDRGADQSAQQGTNQSADESAQRTADNAAADSAADNAADRAAQSTAQCVEITQDLTALLEQAAEIRTEIVESISESDRLLDVIKVRRKKLAALVRDTLIACDKAESAASKTKQAAEIRAENQSATRSEVGSTSVCKPSPSGLSESENSSLSAD